eukprot:2889585-Prymnesium_polylepis.1
MAMRSARKAAARPPSSLWRGEQCAVVSMPAPIAGGAARAGGQRQPVSVVKNLSRGLVDGGAEPHY